MQLSAHVVHINSNITFKTLYFEPKDVRNGLLLCPNLHKAFNGQIWWCGHHLVWSLSCVVIILCGHCGHHVDII